MLLRVEGGIDILLSSIRWGSALESVQKDTAYDSIVVRYVLLGKLRSIMRNVWNLENNRGESPMRSSRASDFRALTDIDAA